MARIKHVFPHDDVARVWLRQSQAEGKSKGKGQMYFSGDTIFSFGSHFPIARIFKAPNGEEVILFTTRTYSMTTTRHINAVQHALRGSSKRVVYCDSVGSFDDIHNIAHYKSELNDAIAKHKKARKPELYTGDILYHAACAREYCEVMCLPVPSWALMPDWGFVATDKLFKGAPMRAWLQVQAEERVAA